MRLKRKEYSWLLRNVYFGMILTVRGFWHVAFEIEFFPPLQKQTQCNVIG